MNLKLILEILAAAPAAISVIRDTVSAVEKATDTTSAMKAAVDGLESLLEELKKAL